MKKLLFFAFTFAILDGTYGSGTPLGDVSDSILPDVSFHTPCLRGEIPSVVARAAVISDIHFGSAKARGALRSFIDSARGYDLVLATGDLTEMGRPAELDALREEASRIAAPFVAVPGNHDLRWSAGGWAGVEARIGPRHRRVELGDVTVLALDSSVFGEAAGCLDRGQVEWLRRELESVPRAAVLALHHGPFHPGRHLLGEEALEEILVASGKVRLILCGHGHGYGVWRRSGIPVVMTGALYADGGFREIRTAGARIEVFRAGPGGSSVPDVVVDLDRPLPPAPTATGRPLPEGGIEVRVRGAGGKLLRALLDGVEVQARFERDGEEVRMGLDSYGLAPGSHDVLLLFGERPDEVLSARASVEVGRTEARAVDIGAGVLGGSASIEGKAVVGGLDGRLRGIDLEGGRVEWTVDLGGRILARPEAAGSRAVAGTEAGQAAGVDPGGREAWRAPLGAAATGAPRFDPGSGLCIVPTGRGAVAIDPRDGSVRWTAPADGPVHGRPAVMGDKVFFGSWDGRLRAVDISTGAERWSFLTDPSPYFAPGHGSPAAWTSPEWRGSVLLTFIPKTAATESILSFDAVDGRKIWGLPGSSGFATPLLAGGRAILTEAGGSVRAVSLADGRPLWSRSIGGGLWRGSPVEAGGPPTSSRKSCLLFTLDGTLHEMDPADGSGRPLLRLPRAVVLSTPEVVGNRIVLPTYDGKVWILSR
jgi:Icc protein